MRNWMRLGIGILDIVGGLLGIVVTAFQMKRADTAVELVIVSLFLGLFGFGIVSGVLLVRSHRAALACNRAFWILQVPAFSSPWVTYAFAVGISLPVTVQFIPLQARIGWFFGSDFLFFVGGMRPVTFSLNLAALVLVIVLVRAHLRLSPPIPDKS